MKKPKQKILSVILAVMLVFGAMTSISISASAAQTGSSFTTTVDSAEYSCTVLDDNSVCITSTTVDKAELAIPSQIEGHTVSQLGKRAVFANMNLTNVTIPDTVTQIDESAFANCLNLENVKLPNNLDTISTNMFYSCRSLNNVELPLSVKTIGESAFMGCGKLANISITENIERVGYTAFFATEWLNAQEELNKGKVLYIGSAAYDYIVDLDNMPTSITLKDGTKSITREGFAGHSTLEEVILPNSLEYIGEAAFLHSNNIKSIKIPASVTEIYNCAYGAVYDSVEQKWTGNKDCTIYGYAGSAAEEYANIMNIAFIDMAHSGVRGDADGDGVLTVNDATIIQRYVAGIVDLDEVCKVNAGYNLNGTVTVDDATAIQRFLAGEDL